MQEIAWRLWAIPRARRFTRPTPISSFRQARSHPEIEQWVQDHLSKKKEKRNLDILNEKGYQCHYETERSEATPAPSKPERKPWKKKSPVESGFWSRLTS